MKSISWTQMDALLDFEPTDYKADWTEIDRVYESNWSKLEAIDHAARDRGELVGRIIKKGMADGYALYLITKENKATVRINHITGLGDDYMDSYWGKQANISKAFAVQLTGAEDRWAAAIAARANQ